MNAVIPETRNSLAYRQYMRGLSFGVFVGSVAGFFWANLSAWSADCARAGLPPWTREDVPLHYVPWVFWTGAAAAALIAGAVRVGRRARGFKFSQLRKASDQHRQLSRRITRSFLLTVAGEGAGCCAAALLGMHFHREDLIWPAVSAVVSLHFLPLARIFRKPSYMVTAVAGGALSIALLLVPASALAPAARVGWLGLAMAPLMWGMAVHGMVTADRLARNWAQEISQ